VSSANGLPANPGQPVAIAPGVTAVTSSGSLPRIEYMPPVNWPPADRPPADRPRADWPPVGRPPTIVSRPATPAANTYFADETFSPAAPSDGRENSLQVRVPPVPVAWQIDGPEMGPHLADPNEIPPTVRSVSAPPWGDFPVGFGVPYQTATDPELVPGRAVPGPSYWAPPPDGMHYGPPSDAPIPLLPGESYVPGGSLVPDSGEFHDGNVWEVACEMCEDEIGQGLGASRLPFATFEIEAARPTTVLHTRIEMGANWDYPDRAEYFWAKAGTLGPQFGETSTDYQDVRIHYEQATGKFSFFTDYLIRSVNPEFNANTAGFGDMVVGTKLVLHERRDIQVTHLFKTYIPTGYGRRGLGTQHVAMEHGILMNYRLGCATYFHGQLSYWFPIPHTPDYSGTVLKWGGGFSHLLYENVDRDFAIIPTLEFVGWTIFDGSQAPGGFVPIPEDVGPTGIFNVYLGSRFLLQEQLEFGINGGLALTSDHWYDKVLRFDFRIWW